MDGKAADKGALAVGRRWGAAPRLIALASLSVLEPYINLRWGGVRGTGAVGSGEGPPWGRPAPGLATVHQLRSRVLRNLHSWHSLDLLFDDQRELSPT